MSFAEELFNLRSPNATMVQVADAIDGIASGRKSNVVFSGSGSETVDSENVIFINNSTDITRTLPAPSTCQGKTFIYVKISANANTCTISAASGSIFGDYSNVLSARRHYVAYVSDGANYFQLGGSSLASITWTPTYTPSAGMTLGTVTTNRAFYQRRGNTAYFEILFTTGTIGGTLGNNIRVSLPINLADLETPFSGFHRQPLDSGTIPSAHGRATGSPINGIVVRKHDGSNFTANTLQLGISGWARLA